MRPLLILASCALVACSGSGDASSTSSSTSAAMTLACGAPPNGAVQGVDVSHFQGALDWRGARVAFGYASVGDGAYVDPLFETNWANMKAAGVLRGAYQYFEPGDDPVAQANLVVAKVGRLGAGDLPAMIDVEVTGGRSGAAIAAGVRTWLEIVEAGTGKRPIVYTGAYFWESSVGDASFGAYPLWIASYGVSCPKVPAGWSSWLVWQYSDGGGALDHDVFNGSEAALLALASGSPPELPSPSDYVGIASTSDGEGYWVTKGDGGIFSFGDAVFHGSAGDVRLSMPAVGMAVTSDVNGYWIAAADGGVFTYGDAAFLGSIGGKPLAAPVVGVAGTKSGYWMAGADGGVFSFGAPFYGSMGGKPLAAPVAGIASTPSGAGYWLVARDGGVFAFGDAQFHGSMGGKPLAAPVVGIASTPSGHGYWLVAADGGVFTFGDARFYGSMGDARLNAAVSGIGARPQGDGYWLVAKDGGVFSFGAAGFHGRP